MSEYYEFGLRIGEILLLGYLLAVKNSTRATEDLVIVRRPNDDDDYYYYYYYYVSVWSLQALLNRSFSDF